MIDNSFVSVVLKIHIGTNVLTFYYKSILCIFIINTNKLLLNYICVSSNWNKWPNVKIAEKGKILLYFYLLTRTCAQTENKIIAKSVSQFLYVSFICFSFLISSIKFIWCIFIMNTNKLLLKICVITKQQLDSYTHFRKRWNYARFLSFKILAHTNR